MLYENRHVLPHVLKGLDALALPAVAVALRAASLPPFAWDAAPPGALVLYSAILFTVFLVVGQSSDLYQTHRTETLARELRGIAWCVLLAVSIACLAVEVGAGGLPGRAHAAVGIVGFALLLGTRLLVRGLLRGVRRAGRNTRTWLLVGWNPRAAEIGRTILARPHFGIRIAGLLDLPRAGERSEPWSGFDEELRSSLPPVKDLKELRRMLAEHAIDEVVVTLPVRSFYNEVESVLQICAEAGVSVALPPQTFEAASTKAQVVRVASVPLFLYYSGPAGSLSLTAKRLLDLGVSGFGLLVLSPFLLGLAFLVRASSPGPAFFRQTRVGLNGRRFTLYKFRTMYQDAEARRAELERSNEVSGPVFKIRWDPRVTPVGRWLRRFHVDEFPQLWNVLRGEMSLVGPRPPVPEEVERYDWWQRRRLSMPPGLTCLWQVEGRHGIPFQRWVQLDLDYIDHWTLGLDLRLLLRTIPVLLRGDGW